MTLYWKTLEREVILEGPVIVLPEAIAQDYFSKRPRNSQLGTLASKQGEVLPNKECLLDRYLELEKRYAEKPIPTPASWRGYSLNRPRLKFGRGPLAA